MGHNGSSFRTRRSRWDLITNPTKMGRYAESLTLLDRLIVAFFEKGNIRSAEGVVAFVGAPALEQSGSSVAQRLEAIVETLRSGSRVGLLPSNARLGPEHSVRLARLLEYVSEALS